jgi:hypothetical protein
LVGVAVNVTLAPEQMVLSASLDAMLTLAGKLPLILIVMLLEVAVLGTAHEELDVNSQVTTSPLDSDELE